MDFLLSIHKEWNFSCLKRYTKDGQYKAIGIFVGPFTIVITNMRLLHEASNGEQIDDLRRQNEELTRNKGILVHMIEDGNILRTTLQSQNAALRVALEDAINSPKGVCPDSYYQAIAHNQNNKITKE